MANLVEVIVGTYEEFILGYKVDGSASGNTSLAQSFATKSHTGSIRCVAVAKHYVASGGGDDRIFIYDMKTRKESQILHHHVGTVNAINFTPDVSHLLTGSDDGKMCAVRTGTWQIEGSWKKAHSGSAVTHISCHPSGKLALTLGNDQTLRTWNLIKGRLAYTTNLKTRAELGRNPDCLYWSPDGDHFTITGMRVLEIWSVKTAGVVREFKCESKPVSVCWLSAQDVAVGFEDGQLWILNFKSKSEPVSSVAHKQRVKGISFMNDILATASSSGEICLWTVNLEDKTISKITSTNIGCRPTCIALLDLTQFGDDYALKSEPDEVGDEVSDDKGESSSKNKIKSVGSVVVEVEEDDEEEDDIEKAIVSPIQSTKKHKKKSKGKVAQDEGEEKRAEKKKKKKKKQPVEETSFDNAVPQRKRKSENNETHDEETTVLKKHKKKKSKRID